MKLQSNRPPTPNDLFDRVYKSYDKINYFLSFGQVSRWRYDWISMSTVKKLRYVVDICCGTGENARIARKIFQNIYIMGIDINQTMLSMANSKEIYDKLILSPAEDADLARESFELCLLSFGFYDLGLSQKNVLDKIYYCLVPQGELLIMELGLPHNSIIRKIYKVILNVFSKFFYFLNIKSLGHLLQEIEKSPSSEYMVDLANGAHFKLVAEKKYMYGLVSAYKFMK